MHLNREPSTRTSQSSSTERPVPVASRANFPGTVMAALIVAALLIALPHALAAADRLIAQTTAPDGRSVVLIAGADATFVRQGDVLERLALPPDAWLNRIGALEQGWVAGGARRTADGQDLFLLLQLGEGPAEIPPPPERIGRIRQSAVPIVGSGRLLGMAWLEGDDLSSLGVYASTLTEDGWGPVEPVSTEPEGQVALSGVILSDGRWLLTSSLYDGADSETVWSVRSTDGSWSVAAPLHEPNDVPDLTPALIAGGDGALAAWTFFDGTTMRMRLSRFVRGAWSDTGYRGPDGSVYPGFFDGPDGPRLLFQTVVPRGWTLLRLDARGRIGGLARLEVGTDERPVVEENDGGVLLRWPSTDDEVPDRTLGAGWEDRP